MTNRIYALAGAVLASLLVFSPAANAATFDFEFIADNVAPGEYGATSIVFNDGGIQLTATGRDFNNAANPYNAYLDSGNAGLGVCKVLGGSGGDQCDPSNDDNVTRNEIVQLSFDKLVSVTSITFRDGDHGTTFEGLAGFATGKTGAVLIGDFAGFDPNNGNAITSFGALMSLQIIAGSTYQPDVEGVTRQLYISSITVEAEKDIPGVPEPATVGLFGLGLIALGIRARRKPAAK